MKEKTKMKKLCNKRAATKQCFQLRTVMGNYLQRRGNRFQLFASVENERTDFFGCFYKISTCALRFSNSYQRVLMF